MKQLLCHEYLQRHSLAIPLVLNSDKTNVILRNKEQNAWRIFSLHWRAQDYHPGFYEVNYFEIVHNGLQNKKCFKDIIRTQIWNWDQYEINVLKIVEEIKNKNFLAIKQSESLLAAWFIFVYLADSCLASKFDCNFFEILNKSLYNKLPVKKRLNAILEAENFLKNDSLIDFWNHRIKPIAQPTNNKWLIKLIND